MAELKAMTQGEVFEGLERLNGWALERQRALVKTFEFADFMGPVAFVNRIAEEAERQNHHPDLEVGWGRLTVRLSTHSVGGVTVADFALAEAIEKRFER